MTLTREQKEAAPTHFAVITPIPFSPTSFKDIDTENREAGVHQ